MIDDEADMGELICATARKLGLQCSATTGAKTFLDTLSPNTTLVILDLLMPEMDGIEILRLLGKRKCRAGIVLMSGVGKRTLATAKHLAGVLGLSVLGHLQKPFRIPELEEILQRLPCPETPKVAVRGQKVSIQKHELQQAIDHDEFIVHYQPQIQIATGCVNGVEALVRWQHPSRGLIFPDMFIGRAERFGIVDELGWIVADRAMREVSKFANTNGTALALSLNASISSLRSLNFPDLLLSIANKHGISPENLTIEITETGVIKELARTLDTLTRLRMNKVKLSIDDFGTGYAVMQQFKNLPATELKIDKSFVQDMLRDETDRIMVQKIVEMGQELGMQVTAEGVETQAQFNFLRELGCDQAQGFLFSRAIPAEEMVRWLYTYRNRLLTLPPRGSELFRWPITLNRRRAPSAA